MSNDLVKQLRNRADRWMKYDYEEHAKTDTEAADRIEQLEKALQSMLKVPNSEAAYGIIRVFAHNALEKKDGKEDRG